MRSTDLDDRETVGTVAGLMRLLGDPTRIRVLGMLREGERNVTSLCGELDLAQPTVSHHLGLLRTSGLVLTRRDGKQIFYSLNPEHLAVNDGEIRLQFGPVSLVFRNGANGHVGRSPVALAG
jgi:DNA-binding transcriptional ArsR family regulator